MGNNKISDQTPIKTGLPAQLESLGLPFMRDNYDMLANQAAQKGLCHVDYLAALADGEAGLAPATLHQKANQACTIPGDKNP